MNDFTILSWNVQGRKSRGTNSTPFKKILPFLAKGTFDIICLQEMCDATQKIINEAAFQGYNVFIPKLNSDRYTDLREYNQNVLLSKHPIEDVREIHFSSDIGRGAPFENATRADIRIGNKLLRLYNCHLAVAGGAGIATRQKQLSAIFEDSASHQGPTIVCGDMNPNMTSNWLWRKVIRWWWKIPDNEMHVNGRFIDEDERVLFRQKITMHGFMDHIDLHTPTWSMLKTSLWETFGLKLDWFLTKNLRVAEVELGDYISDHRPVIARCEEK